MQRCSRAAFGGTVIMLGIALILCGLFGGCYQGYSVETVSRPQVDPWQPVSGKGTLCVLRPQSFGALATVLHFDNGWLVGATRGAGVYFCYHVAPGWHRLVARTDNDARLRVLVRPGERRFVQVVLRMGPESLEPVSEAQARTWIPRLSYVVARPDDTGRPRPFRGTVPALRASVER